MPAHGIKSSFLFFQFSSIRSSRRWPGATESSTPDGYCFFNTVVANSRSRPGVNMVERCASAKR